MLYRKGVSHAVLFVDESNESAKKLYDSLGFRLDREDRLVRFRPQLVDADEVAHPVGNGRRERHDEERSSRREQGPASREVSDRAADGDRGSAGEADRPPHHVADGRDDPGHAAG